MRRSAIWFALVVLLVAGGLFALAPRTSAEDRRVDEGPTASRTFRYYEAQYDAVPIALYGDDDDDGWRKRETRLRRLVEQDRARSRVRAYRQILDEDDDGDRRRKWNRFQRYRYYEADDDD